MARWLSMRRREAAEGTPNPAYSAGLARVPGWLDNPREAADENRWHQNPARLVAYRDEGNDWPRHHHSGSPLNAVSGR